MPIVPGHDLAGELLQRLQPQRWPLAIAALPAQTALVGGALRDALLGRLRPQPDLDLVVPSGAVTLCRQLAKRLGGSAVVLDAERDIARLVLQGWSLDLASWEGGSLEADLRRRDYSINALALPLNPVGPLLDPNGGLQDLQQGQLRAISKANLQSDPLRLLRGLRIAWDLQFTLESQTRRWISELNEHLAGVTSERVLAELDKLAHCSAGAGGLLEVQQLGLLEPWLPADVTLQTPLARLSPERAQALGMEPAEQHWALPLARLACLADAGALARLHSSRQLQERVGRLRDGWELLQGRPPSALDEATQFKLHASLEQELPALLLLLPEHDEHNQLLQRWREPSDPLCHPKPPLDGHRLQQQLQRPPGPWLGQLLRHLSRERAFGRLAVNASEAEVFAAAALWLQQTEPAAGNRRRD